jgi:site-specific DNA-methyltransferase (adenine-specific)
MTDLRLGDCLAPDGLPSLPDRSVAHVVTDPPFDRRAHRAAVEVGARVAGKRRVSGELPFAPLDPGRLPEVAGHLARVARRWILVFSGERQTEAWATALEAAGARFIRLGYAVRTNPRPQLSGDRPAPAADPIVIAYATGERPRWNGGGRSGKWPSPPARFDLGGQAHPTQKPLALMRALLEDFTDAGELVADPFAGAGSTAVACSELGRRFIGWELSPEYHAAAVARLAGTVPAAGPGALAVGGI